MHSVLPLPSTDRRELLGVKKEKQSIWKSIWKASGLNEKAFKFNFGIHGEKVRFDLAHSFPLIILGCMFTPPRGAVNGYNHFEEDIQCMKNIIKRNYFNSLIWCTYRKNLETPLLSDSRSQKFLQLYAG